jgi:CheY-like chemotaxis protein
VSVPRILVAEDNETTRQILALYFSATNYEIDFAPDGKVALELWREKKYDLVILDCHMPGIDGFAVAEEIRIHEPVSRKTPLMALTAATMQEDVERCIKAGMDEVWSKPISKMQLLGNIQRLLN